MEVAGCFWWRGAYSPRPWCVGVILERLNDEEDEDDDEEKEEEEEEEEEEERMGQPGRQRYPICYDDDVV